MMSWGLVRKRSLWKTRLLRIPENPLPPKKVLGRVCKTENGPWNTHTVFQDFSAPIHRTELTMNAERRAQIAKKVTRVFEKHPGVDRIPGANLVSMVVFELAPRAVDWSQACVDVQEYLTEEINAGRMTRTKGRTGGIGFPSGSRLSNIPTGTLPPPMPAIVSVAINDHTCPGCGNNRCSKSERTCWKCGGKL